MRASDRARADADGRVPSSMAATATRIETFRKK
jgi:hypothetical protein